MDAMVTGRVPAEKKQRGGEILRTLGETPSSLINKLYDYVIETKALPDLSRPSVAHSSLTADKLDQARAFFAESTLLSAVPVATYSGVDLSSNYKDVLSEALEAKYGPVD